MTAMRSQWVEHLERMARPVLEVAAAGALRARMPIACHQDCAEGRIATAHLEAVGRLLAGIAPWLVCPDLEGPEAALREELLGLAQASLRHGFDPDDDDYLGFDLHQQTLVDAAFLAQGLLRARPVLWDSLAEPVRQMGIAAFRCLRDRRPYFNNWLLFGAMTEAFLSSIAAGGDPMRIDYALRQHEQWYVGDGVYSDGPRFHCDYYNSYVIQPMQMDILAVVAAGDDDYRHLQTLAQKRLTRWAGIQERMIAADGTWPVLGRSITYRVGAFQGLAQAALLDLLPPSLAPAQVRCALTAACARSLDAPGTYDADGWLRIGLNGHQPQLAESYITTGSQYLAACVFLPLGLPPHHPFWTNPDAPWTSVRIWQDGGDLPADHALLD